MIAPDLGTLGDPGSWEDAIKYVRFPVGDFKPAQHGGGRLPDGDGSARPVRSFHDAGDTL